MKEEGRAKVFWTGRSQAVRLPKEFRFDVEEVTVRRIGRALVLEPVEKPAWSRGFWERFSSLPELPDDFVLPERPAPAESDGRRDEVIEEWVRDEDYP